MNQSTENDAESSLTEDDTWMEMEDDFQTRQ